MKTIRLIVCVTLGMMLMVGVNSCENKKNSGSEVGAVEKVKTEKPQNNASGKIVLIDFYATWCGPCKAMTPVMEQMEEKYGDKIEFRRIDVDQDDELANKYNVQSIPNIVILSPNEEVIENIVGYHDANQMDKILSEVLDK